MVLIIRSRKIQQNARFSDELQDVLRNNDKSTITTHRNEDMKKMQGARTKCKMDANSSSSGSGGSVACSPNSSEFVHVQGARVDIHIGNGSKNFSSQYYCVSSSIQSCLSHCQLTIYWVS